MYPKREVFPNSPLALVAAEIRFTDAPRLRQQSTLDAIAVALEDILPVQAQHEQAINVQMVAGQPPQVQVAAGRLMKDVASTAAMTLFPDRLTFETTAYAEFEAFRSAVLACTTALVEAHVTPAIQRVGLRYLDEIRVPSATVADARDWREWIDTRLVDHLLIGPTDAPITRAEGLISYDLSERQGLNFRFAALPNGAVVLSANLVRQPFEQDLPLFVLDFDGYEEFTAPTATLLDAGVVARTLDAVHGPSGATFQNAITDAAREIFRVRNLMETTQTAQTPTAVGQSSSIKDYDAVSSTSALSISAAWLRTDVDLAQSHMRRLQEQTHTLDLDDRAYSKATATDVLALLEELAHSRGMSWADIAAAGGVSVSAIRKWRNGGTATAENRQRLAQIAAFLDILEEKGVADPAQWMEMTLPLPVGYHIRPLDLYADGHAGALLELVEQRQEAQQILGVATPGWRDKRSDFEVFIDVDGQRSLRRRGE